MNFSKISGDYTSPLCSSQTGTETPKYCVHRQGSRLDGQGRLA